MDYKRKSDFNILCSIILNFIVIKFNGVAHKILCRRPNNTDIEWIRALMMEGVMVARPSDLKGLGKKLNIYPKECPLCGELTFDDIPHKKCMDYEAMMADNYIQNQDQP